jgi:hypothetical protein
MNNRGLNSREVMQNSRLIDKAIRQKTLLRFRQVVFYQKKNALQIVSILN